MRRISFWHLAFGCSCAAMIAAACGDPFGQNATVENTVDTVTLYALRDTPIRSPSAYDMLNLLPARTDTTSLFDFAFDIDAEKGPLIFPSGALGLSPEPGVQVLQNRMFDDVHSAPTTGYVTDSALGVSVGSLFVARSRVSTLLCLFVSVPRYGKFEVLSVDPVNRSITLQALVDINCGFHGLEPGIPGS